ncbi:hypothetical protein RRF57_006668 [Xylaria bambusicola]|uniref:Uncharacterized protein n=1 Tax=Xylaria bambusicola TaxID=326684 RepID=A0AAN7Z9E9_9PEZI
MAALFLTILRKPKTNPQRRSPRRPPRLSRRARVSRIYNCYRPQGTISNENLLYVPSLFAVEPTR